MNILDFIKIEVWRQGFFPEHYNFMQRVGWMQEAWDYAIYEAAKSNYPSMADIMEIGRMVEHECNMHGFRRMNVQRANDWKDIGVNWPMIGDSMGRLMKFQKEMTAREFYKEFEEIHPFEDGNGRTGKIIFNWMNGTLEDPLFPPDYWGKGVA